MMRVFAASFAAIAVGLALSVASAACRRPAVTRAPDRGPTHPEAHVGGADPSRLPEDPVAGKQSELQWQQHMVEEERERQWGFDHQHLKEHRAVVQLITAARAGYDRARTLAAVTKVRAGTPQRIAEIRRRVTAIDHWGVNSRLLQDYDALLVSLGDAYASASMASIRGDAGALTKARTAFDQHMKKVTDWLDEAAESEEP